MAFSRSGAKVKLGMITPSSNTVLEPVTCAIVSGLPEVSLHFSRFRVTEIALSDRALGQFALDRLLEAALLLADAKVDVIAWNGTSAGWLGFAADQQLCQEVEAKTGMPATTAILALNERFRQQGVKTFGLVTPYRDQVQQKIIANYQEAGFDCISEQYLNQQDNFSFSEVTPSEIETMVRQVAIAQPDAITPFCTNLRAAPLVRSLEATYQIPIYDTISVTVWKALQLAGIDPSRVQGWGSLFRG
jgi:maleate isomerase